MANLMAASHQWQNRPDDERFENLEALLAYCTHEKQASIESKPLPFRDFKVLAKDGEVLVGGNSRTAKTTHFSFGQVSSIARSPADFLRQLPAELVAKVLNDRLNATALAMDKEDLRLLLRQNGELTLRAATSEQYSRIWNADVVREGLCALARDGWMVPPARPAREGQRGTRKATLADILPNQGDFGLAVHEGDTIAPAGLYASDRDLWAFMVDPRRCLDLGGRLSMRGAFISNSEVGLKSFIISWFEMDEVCGNHIVWGARNRQEIRIRHIGDASLEKALAQFQIEAKVFDAATGERQQAIKTAQRTVLGATGEEVVAAAFKQILLKRLPLSQAQLEAASNTAELFEERYGNPRTLWALVSGLTQNSQECAHMNERHAIDAAAGRLMELAF